MVQSSREGAGYSRFGKESHVFTTPKEFSAYVSKIDEKHQVMGIEYLDPQHKGQIDSLIQKLFSLNDKENETFSFFDERLGRNVEGVRKNDFHFFGISIRVMSISQPYCGWKCDLHVPGWKSI
jgi:hypothetical protein